MASNMMYSVAFGVGLKCPLKIPLNTKCKGGTEQTRLDSFLQNNIQKIDIEILAIIYALSSFYCDNNGYEFFMRGIQVKYISTLK